MPRRKTITNTDALGRRRSPNSRGFGKVRQLKSGNWQASYVGPDAQRYNAPMTFAAKVDAEAWLAKVQETIRRETWKPPKVEQGEKFGEYAAAWVEQRRNRKGEPLAPGTQAKYRYQINARMSEFARTRLQDITTPMLVKWHADRLKQSGATTAGNDAKVMRAILNTAVEHQIIERNPMPSKLAATKTGLTHRPPTEDELAALVETITPRFRLAVLLAAFGGLRIGEWRALRRSDLTLTDTGHYVVSVERQAIRLAGEGWLTTPPKSEDGIRQVALPSWLSEDVTAHLHEHVGRFGKDLLFVACDCSDPAHVANHGDFADQAWRRAWNDARQKVGVVKVVREHDLRHFYGSSLAAKGLGIRQLQAALGHGSPQASLTYLHAAKGADTTVADLFQPLPAASASNVKPLVRGA